MDKSEVSVIDPWSDLKQYTSARIAIGRSGGSLTSKEWLDFKLAHAKARDAVHCEFASDILVSELEKLNKKVLVVNSQIKNRREYLQRPDLGRRLDNKSIETLTIEKQSSDLAVIVCDGLSASAGSCSHIKSINNITTQIKYIKLDNSAVGHCQIRRELHCKMK